MAAHLAEGSLGGAVVGAVPIPSQDCSHPTTGTVPVPSQGCPHPKHCPPGPWSCCSQRFLMDHTVSWRFALWVLEINRFSVPHFICCIINTKQRGWKGVFGATRCCSPALQDDSQSFPHSNWCENWGCWLFCLPSFIFPFGKWEKLFQSSKGEAQRLEQEP